MKRKILSFILAVCVLLSVAPLTVTAADDTTDSGYKMGDIIELGSYPQSEVKDSALIAELDKLDKNWKSYDYSYGTGRWQDQLSYLDMNYADISYGGEKYRAVTFSQYRPNLAYRQSTEDNSNQGSNGYLTDNVYYFKYEPLKWRVIDPVEGFVICTQAIDSRAYRENYYCPDNSYEYYCFVDYERYASDWKVSEIRTWLNGDFSSTAFTDDELSKIGTTENESKSTEDSEYDGAKSYDKVFLLSYYDVVNNKYGFNTDQDAEDSARTVTPTDYAKCQGIAVENSSTVAWLLRSPYDSGYTSGISKEGLIGLGKIDITEYGIVPAFKLNPAGYEISVTFDLNGGEWADGYTAPTSYLSNEALQFPTDANVKKTGFMLEGWEETSRSDTSVSYKAKWTARMYDLKYTLAYKDLGLTGKNELLQCVEYGKDYVYTFETAPKGCGYIVDNFYVKIADASGNMQLLDKSKYAIDTKNCTITIPGELVKGNIEIYIERDWKNYTVKFNDTGSATIADKTVHWNDKVLDGVADPTRNDGYEFMGWVADNPKPWVATPNTTYGEIADDDSLTTITLLGVWKDFMYPSIIGLENGKTYCGARKFEVEDNGPIAAVFVNNTYAQPDNDGLYTAPVADGAYEIIVLDGGGNKTKITITVNADHSYGDWKYDEDSHWKECANGDSVIEKGEHTYEWITDKEATETETGVAHEECSVCHAKRNENTEVSKLPTKWDNIKAWFIGIFAKIIKWFVDMINSIC